MKPDFALSLSFEGIGLLTRRAGGWHLLGDVTLDSEDLAGDLEKLRAKGEAVAKGPFVTAVVLPNDQIKYLSLDTGRARDAKRRDAAIVALEESTPYRADQLAFDIHAVGRNTQVAAVARETLEEAEAFATEHAFNPVRFTAMPPEGSFDTAPDFGPTGAAPTLLKNAAFTPDPTPIHIISSGDLPDPVPEPVPSPPPQAETDAPVVPKTEAGAPTGNAASPASNDTPGDLSAKAEEKSKASESPVAFASIRAHRETPDTASKTTLGGASRTAQGTNAPGIPGDSGPTASRSLRFDPAKVVAGLKADAPQPEPRSTDETAEDDGGFVSRRQLTKAASKFKKKPALPSKHSEAQDAQNTDSEQQRLTVFGARTDQSVGGKPKYLGLIMTAVLLLFLAAVALWAALFLENGVAGLFGREDEPQIVLLDPEAAVIADEETIPTQGSAPSQTPPEEELAETEANSQASDSLATDILTPAAPGNITDSAEIEAMEDSMHPTALSENEAEARYAVTGIWERAPQPPTTPTAGSTEDLYATSIDRVLIAQDAVALPDPTGFLVDQPLNAQLNPVAPGTRFELDDRGLVVASAQGTLNPEGVMVYLGRPPVLPASLPNRAEADSRALSREDEQRLASIRPRFRPGDLVESNERATMGGLSRAELGRIRPKPRPTTEKDAAESDNTPTGLAVAASLRPRQRPSNIAQLAQRSKPTEAVVATPAAATITPKIPTTASVARQATIQNAINLNKINLIGVYGTSNNRRALVRLANGRYRKVQVGDRIDGGKVAAIDDQELRYVKSGRNIVLKMPKG